jgi:hypothetical protein
MFVDLFLVYSFIKRLATPFNEWPAYKLGIIDEKGNQLKKRSELKTVKEQDAFGIFDQMILRLKRLLEKVPGGNTRLGSYAAALWLIKEQNTIKESEDLLTDVYINDSLIAYMHYINESVDVNKKFELMFEDGVPANNVGGGAIAGVGVGPNGEPGLSKAAQRKWIRSNGKVMRRNANT